MSRMRTMFNVCVHKYHNQWPEQDKIPIANCRFKLFIGFKERFSLKHSSHLFIHFQCQELELTGFSLMMIMRARGKMIRTAKPMNE